MLVCSAVLIADSGLAAVDGAPRRHGPAHLDPDREFIERGACPFECCGYGRWWAEGPLTVYRREGDTTRVAYRLRDGERFTAVTGNVHVLRAGIVRMTRATPAGQFLPFETTEGESLFVLDYQGDAVWEVWHRGYIHTLDQFWDDEGGPELPCELLRAPESNWWARIVDRRGRPGWLFMDRARVGGAGGCE
ncbi:MAG: hypothetical protein HZB25_08505 [Candidatus Eisenbacteria bacterium]|nr:hypothetical protein [Candidatus Eisenbacteria bacterium]